jgi:hypothetical protein
MVHGGYVYGILLVKTTIHRTVNVGVSRQYIPFRARVAKMRYNQWKYPVVARHKIGNTVPIDMLTIRAKQGIIPIHFYLMGDRFKKSLNVPVYLIGVYKYIMYNSRFGGEAIYYISVLSHKSFIIVEILDFVCRTIGCVRSSFDSNSHLHIH